VGAAEDVFHVVLLQEAGEGACEFSSLIGSNLQWSTIGTQHVLEYPTSEILSLPSRNNIQEYEFAEVIHTYYDVTPIAIRHLQSRGEIDAPRFPR
jgi:hypothetical protein